MVFASSSARLLSPKECDQVRYFGVCETDAEASVVELNDVGQGCSRAIMEIGSARGQAAKNRPLEPSDVLPLAGDESPARISRLDTDIGRVVLQSVEGQIGSPARGVRQADIQRRRDRMVADIGRVVAGAAEARYRLDDEIVVQSLHTRDGDRSAIE